MFQKPSKIVLLISFILALGFQTVTFALDMSILDSLSALLGSVSSNQSVPTSSAPTQSDVKPSFQRVVVGVDGGDSQVLLGDDETSGIVTQRTVGLGIETSGLLGITTGTLGHTGLFVENNSGIGVLGLSSNGTGVTVKDATDIGIFTSGSSVGLYSQGMVTAIGRNYGGVLGTSTNATGVIALGSQYGAKLNDGSYLGANGIGIYSAHNAFIGDEYTIFSIHDATLSNGLQIHNAQADLATLDILNAAAGISSDESLELAGSLQVNGNDLFVAQDVTVEGGGGASSNFIGGSLSFLYPPNAFVQIGPESASSLGINDNVQIQGNFYAERNITAKTMGNITVHEETSTGDFVQVSCANQETIMGCSASIDEGGYTDITEVYPSSNYCNAERSSGDTFNFLHVYAYCFEPGGVGNSDSCGVPSTPTGLSVRQDNETITFSWNAVSQADGYCLKFYDSRKQEFNSLCFNGTGTSLTKSLDYFDEGSYFFSVAAQDTSCNEVSPDSDLEPFTVKYPDGTLCDPDHYDPDLCATIHIDFDPDFSDAEPDYEAPIDWYWEPLCDPLTTCVGEIVEVTGTDCSGVYCPDYMTASGDVLADPDSMLYAWSGLDASTGDAVGDLTVTGLAYMLQVGNITATEAAYISDQNLVNDAKEILETSHFGNDGTLVSGEWTGYDSFANDLNSILNQIGTYDLQTQSRSPSVDRGDF